MMEQVAGQTLSSNPGTSDANLFYWAKPKQKGEAEIDFCYQWNNYIIGIDVKSSAKKPAKALFSFKNAVNNAIAVESDLDQFGKKSVTFSEETYEVVYIPIYLLGCIDQYLPGI